MAPPPPPPDLAYVIYVVVYTELDPQLRNWVWGRGEMKHRIKDALMYS